MALPLGIGKGITFTRSRGDLTWRAEQRNWYAPALGWVVKFEAFTTDGRRQSWQLVSVD